MKKTTPLAVLFLPLVLTGTAPGCAASSAPAGTAVDNRGDERACFNVKDALSFSALHDKFVYVRCRRDRHYLLTMENICLGLKNSTAISIASGFNRVCTNDRATITYNGLGRTSRCSILTVEAVEDRAAAEKLVESRTRPK